MRSSKAAPLAMKKEPNQTSEPTATMRPFSGLSFAATTQSFLRVAVAHL